MVIITHKAEDISASTSGDVTTISRRMRVEGDSLMEIVQSSKIPKKDSRHPANSTFQVTEVQFEPSGNLGRRVQATINITYSNEGNVGGDGDKDPWELDASDVNVNYTTENVPLLYGYNKNGDLRQMLNKAGLRLEVQTQHYLRQITFSFAVKAKSSGEAPTNNRPFINKDSVKAAGYTFAPYEAMLMPMNAAYVADVDDDGEIYRRYWKMSATILENDRTWQRKVLNVGTLARLKEGEAPRPIYQYSPWLPKNSADQNARIPPRFGSIDDVIAAQKAYEESGKNEKGITIPYNEITEPMPLTDKGLLFQAAIEDPMKNPYIELVYYEYPPTSWAQWNLPKKRI